MAIDSHSENMFLIVYWIGRKQNYTDRICNLSTRSLNKKLKSDIQSEMGMQRKTEIICGMKWLTLYWVPEYFEIIGN